MNKKWLFALIPFGIVAFVWIGGEAVMHLWNWLAPALFGFRQITFWQGLGLLVLCRILFGGWGGGGSHGPKQQQRKRWHWERMTPEEYERFCEWMRSRRSGLETAGGTSGEPA